MNQGNMEDYMENKIMNLALIQMKSDNVNQVFNQELFFNEYFKVFYDNKPFSENVIKSIKQDLDINILNSLSNKLINIFEKRCAVFSQIGMVNEIGLILFIGDGNIDGHSIVIDDSTYVFVDLKAVISRSEDNLGPFLSHEIIHAIHYYLNKEFYPKNYNGPKDIYLKTLIAEGLATYMSMLLFGLSEDLAYWLGLLKLNEIKEWTSNCKNMKTSMGIKLKELIVNKEFNRNIYNKLFCINKSEKLTEYRMGYYYGSEIMKNIFKNNSINRIFELEFIDIKNYINEYFESIIV
jgi:hypothetical protein